MRINGRSSPSQTIRRPSRSKVVPLPPIVVLTSSGSLPGRQAQQLIAAQIDEIPVAVRMPEWAFGKDEAGGEALRFRGFEHFGQVIGGRHR